MGDDFKYQASYKFGPANMDMLNVRANSVEELSALLRGAYEVIGDLTLVGKSVRDNTLVGQPVVSQVDSQPNHVGAQVPPAQSQGPPPQWAQPSQPQAMTPTCAHGAREYKEGNKNGKKWAGWFCAAPKGTPGQCQVEWVDQ